MTAALMDGVVSCTRLRRDVKPWRRTHTKRRRGLDRIANEEGFVLNLSVNPWEKSEDYLNPKVQFN